MYYAYYSKTTLQNLTILFLLLLTSAPIFSRYRLILLTPDSVKESISWEQGEEIAVKLETVRGKTIGLAHWSPELNSTEIPFFFEPTDVDYVFSCYAELLDSEIQAKHIFPKATGINYQGRVGQVLILVN
jgi:hypothetical protein